MAHLPRHGTHLWTRRCKLRGYDPQCSIRKVEHGSQRHLELLQHAARSRCISVVPVQTRGGVTGMVRGRSGHGRIKLEPKLCRRIINTMRG